MFVRTSARSRKSRDGLPKTHANTRRSLAWRRSVNDDIAFATILAIVRTCAETVLLPLPKMCVRKTHFAPAGRSAVLLSALRRCTSGALFIPVNIRCNACPRPRRASRPRPPGSPDSPGPAHAPDPAGPPADPPGETAWSPASAATSRPAAPRVM
ncbi:hypothetical protein L810_5657 [Burkholderia sp. AU4i]|nr:hypothetical protein L810_5657 [Burkholderia sp. AU4i]